MFSTPDALLTFSLLVSIVKSTPHPALQSFDPDAPWWDMPVDEPWSSMPLDDLPNEDELGNYDPLANLFDWKPTPDPNLNWNEGELFAANVGSGDFCSAEDMELSPLIGRLRAREGSEFGSGAGKTCVAPKEGDNDEELTPFLLQLPDVEEVIYPPIKGEPDICPPWRFGERDIPLCSSGDRNDEKHDPDTEGITLDNAKLCKSLVRPVDFLRSTPARHNSTYLVSTIILMQDRTDG